MVVLRSSVAREGMDGICGTAAGGVSFRECGAVASLLVADGGRLIEESQEVI